ncbi:MAG: RelA/SpoT domain-containing protein [Bryobacterales bacterium]|nr:RelA/SpoT domain-containing protein [Bryobacterales bacterium]
MQCLATTLQILDDCGPPVRSAVSVRLKRLESIQRKLRRTGANFRLGTLDDVVGARIICQSVADLVALAGRIKLSPYFYRLKSYLTSPAETGYRGIHLIMRFAQPAAANRTLDVRFEIQVRTYLQHRWAVWSESHGEKVKIGQGDSVRHEELRNASTEIAHWEMHNSSRVQDDLFPYVGACSVIVCWRPPHGRVISYPYLDNVGGAVAWLNDLESHYPAQRDCALLLVGVAEHAEVQRTLRLTHPLYVGARAAHPRFYIPSNSS